MPTARRETAATPPPADLMEPTHTELTRQRKFRLLQRKSNEDLVRMHNNNERLKDQLHDDQQLIEAVLNTRFEGVRQEETITTPEGIVKRKVTNAWIVDPEKVQELEPAFTRAELAEIFEEKHKHKVPDSRMADLVQFLGRKVKDFVVTITTHNVTRTAQHRWRADPRFADRLGHAVRVQQEVRITVTPAKP